ncbi:MAG: LuxE/PaaK family acyltransferase [Halobacteriota archaeon]
MEAAKETQVQDRLHRLNERIGRSYVPPRETWTPAEEALYKPVNLLRVPVDEARVMQLKAIKYTFTRHYTLNRFYRRYCDTKGVTPDDVKTYDDLEKIPLVPDLTFKWHPSGKDFAGWIADVYTGDLPPVTIEGANPTFDDVLNAYNAAGLMVTHSTGTSGQPTVIPRDMKTARYLQYGMTKMLIDLWDPTRIDHALSLFPKPTRANLFVAKVQGPLDQFFEDHHYALDFEISAELAMRAAVDTDDAAQQLSAEEQLRKIFTIGATWLERYDKTTDTIWMLAPPALFSVFLDSLEAQGKRFEFGERGFLRTAGGWKTRDGKNIPHESFRKRVEEVLGIPETHCLDIYGMSEMNSIMITCPEGHYYHPPPWLRLFVLDASLTPVGYEKFGRFAFLDPLAYSYPGFVMTGDKVRTLEHCPACDRPGPVIDQTISRMKSAEMRGCAVQLAKIFKRDVGEVK